MNYRQPHATLRRADIAERGDEEEQDAGGTGGGDDEQINDPLTQGDQEAPQKPFGWQPDSED